VTAFSVYLVQGAKQGLLHLHGYVARDDSPQKADKLIDDLQKMCLKLKTLPERRRILPELERIGIREFREVIFKPYRIVYNVLKSRVFVCCVLDSGRELQDVLEERLLR
jgi:toxin ParE1/3/4